MAASTQKFNLFASKMFAVSLHVVSACLVASQAKRIAKLHTATRKANMINAKTIIEFMCTAILVFVIQIAGSAELGPLAIGGILVSIVFAGGPVSGAHYNPAVSLAATVRGELGCSVASAVY